MKSLKEQVKSYIAWRAKQGDKYGPAELAAEIALRQGSRVKTKCKRQNIEHLLNPNKEIARPRYLVELADVMGTTAETLIAGRYVSPSDEGPPPLPPYQQDAVDSVAKVIVNGEKFWVSSSTGAGKALQPGDAKKILHMAARSPRRETIKQLVVIYLTSPDENEDLLDNIDSMVLGGGSNPKASRKKAISQS